MLHRRAFLAAAAAALASSALPSLGADLHRDKLFFIQRSKNANEVHYDARVKKSGALDDDDPVEAYWLNLAEGGGRSSIGMMEKVAYGFDVEPAGKETYRFTLAAFEERTMWLQKDVKGKWRVRTTIGGKDGYLTKLYVATDESGLMPKVLYVDVFGEDLATGAPLKEHLVKG